MDHVEYSTYERDGKTDSVLGWRETRLIDQSTGLPLVWHLGPATAHEPHVLLKHLLPTLFELWPDCPMHTIVADGIFDDDPTTRELETHWSLHPLFTRNHARTTTTEDRRKRQTRVVDGQPHCSCGPMRYVRREGFYTHEHRARDGRRRGVIAPDVKTARVRWRCPTGRCGERSTYASENPRDHTWWPRRGAGNISLDARAYLLYRNFVESSFAVTKGQGIGTMDNPALWARDRETDMLIGLHNMLTSAQRLVHENGDVQLINAEYEALGLNHRGRPPTRQDFADAMASRPPHLRWAWPTPARA